jgi:hypothetical protein
MTSTVKISALTAGSTPAGAEAFPAVQGTSTVKLTLSQVKTFIGAGTGTVTSVALSAPAEFTVSGSPVTHGGTLALAKASQAANAVWAGPASGASAAPSFRTLDARDLPLGVPFALSVVVANVGATGDVATIAVPAGLGDFTAAWGNAANALMKAFSAGAAGSITGTIRTASGGGGAALYTFTSVTPPASGGVTRSTGITTTGYFNASTVTTLYVNFSASSASGTGTVEIALMKL